MFNRLTLIITAVLLFTAAACTPQMTEPQATPIPGLGVTPLATPGTQVGDLAGFVSAVQAEGIAVTIVGEARQPIFPVVGQAVQIDGTDVQLFEFASEQERSNTQSTALMARDMMAQGLNVPVEQLNFWSEGRLIVLYIGQNPAIMDLINRILGAPLTSTAAPEEELPLAVAQAIRTLSGELDATREEFRVVAFEAVDWPDGCLGLGGPAEACLTVIVPGWRVVLEFQDQQYEVRTDREGTQVRWQIL